MKRKIIFFGILIGICILVGCSNSQENMENVEKLKKTTINLGSEPPELNTILSTDSVSFTVIRHVFEGLTRLDERGEVIPAAAKNWNISDDGRTYTFYLRDARWSDGSKLLARDFEFAIKEALKPQNVSQYANNLYIIKNAMLYNMGYEDRENVGVIAKNEHTLIITLERPCAYFLEMTSFATFMPIKQEFYENQNGKYGMEARNMIYNGPWVIDEWRHEEEITLKRNVNYWNQKNIQIDEIKLLMLRGSEVEYNSLINAESDMVTLEGDFVERAKYDGYEVREYQDGATEYLQFNTNNYILRNRNIRTALSLVINKDKVCRDILKNKNLKATRFINPIVYKQNPLYLQEDEAVNQSENNLKAREFLNRGLKELNLDYIPKLEILIDDSDIAEKEAQYYKECITNNLGVEVEIQSLPFKEKIAKMKNGDFQIVLALIAPDYNDPMTYLDIFESSNGNNISRYSNSQYDSLINLAKTEENNEIRLEIIKQTENILLEENIVLPICYGKVNYATNSRIKNIVRNIFQEIELYWAYIQ